MAQVQQVTSRCDVDGTEIVEVFEHLPTSGPLPLPKGWARGVIGKKATNVVICPSCIKALA